MSALSHKVHDNVNAANYGRLHAPWAISLRVVYEEIAPRGLQALVNGIRYELSFQMRRVSKPHLF